MKTIVVDPGHGGWDSGAVAADGIQEKHFNLQLALAVRDALAAYDCRVILTRTTDTALVAAGQLGAELRARANVANQHQADLLISLHHDSTGSASVRGGSLWIWTDKPGWLGARGNHGAPRSHAVAQQVVKPIREALAALGVPWRAWDDPDGIMCSNFQVLRDTNGRAILLEALMGSNPADVAAARRPEFIPQLAQAIAGAVAEALAIPPKAQPAPVWDPRAEIAQLKASGLINGDKEPDAPVTWGELATVLNRVLTRGT